MREKKGKWKGKTPCGNFQSWAAAAAVARNILSATACCSVAGGVLQAAAGTTTNEQQPTVLTHGSGMLYLPGPRAVGSPLTGFERFPSMPGGTSGAAGGAVAARHLSEEDTKDCMTKRA